MLYIFFFFLREGWGGRVGEVGGKGIGGKGRGGSLGCDEGLGCSGARFAMEWMVDKVKVAFSPI